VVCRERTFYPQEELELLASIILLHRNRWSLLLRHGVHDRRLSRFADELTPDRSKGKPFHMAPEIMTRGAISYPFLSSTGARMKQSDCSKCSAKTEFWLRHCETMTESFEMRSEKVVTVEKKILKVLVDVGWSDRNGNNAHKTQSRMCWLRVKRNVDMDSGPREPLSWCCGSSLIH
jgi:hypothetical protein